MAVIDEAMVTIPTLWLPILLSAVIVFVVSSIVHMVLRWHQGDFKRLPSENEVMEALGRFNIPPGDYMMPCVGSVKEMKSPEFVAKRTKGPVAVMTVMKSGPPSMGRNLIQWFIYSIVVGIFAAYVAGRALGPGATYLEVFRIVGTAAFLGYAMALAHDSIWYQRAWSTTFKYMVDGLIYGMMTGGTFGWLWPR